MKIKYLYFEFFVAPDVKYNRNDTSSPVPASLTAGPHTQQAPFINTHAPLHPFSYGNLAFYHGTGMIGGFPAPYTTQMYQVCCILAVVN